MLLKKSNSNKSNHSTAFCVALGGVISALVMLLMFCATMFPMLDYAIPAYAGFLMVVIIVEAGSKWAWITYAACAVLCPLMTPNYEAALLFVLFMGYYPMLYVALGKIENRYIRTGFKLLVFNAAILIYAMIFQYVFTSVDLLEGMESFGKWAAPVLLIMANVFFFFYDRLLGQLIDVYIKWFRKKILQKR
ncbi:MAG: hypothetical protein LUI06_02360 [Ruminococcus sp.]|nr:hypothetical protein [Ruminococcus sp.]